MGKFIFSLVILITVQSHAQNGIGIGTSTPDPSARLDVSATDKGILVPRLTLAQRNAITNPAKGLLVYQTDQDSGFYYNAGSPGLPNWINMLGQSNGWSTKGNSGTNPTINFLGTTDIKPLNFRTNNRKAGTLDDSLHNAFFGVNAGFNTAPSTFFDARHNTFIGDSAGFTNTTGSENTFVGRDAGYSNTTAVANSFFGYQAGQSNTIGQPNAFFGYNSGNFNTSGSLNSFFGYFSGQGNTTGNENAYFGASAGRGDIINGSSGSKNAAFGRLAGQFITSGNSNTFLGAFSGNQTTSGNDNTFLGDSSGYNNLTGQQNVFVGRASGLVNGAGTQNTLLGYSSNLSSSSLTNSTAIGNKSLVGASNSLVLGSISGVNGATADTKVGIGTTTPTNKLHIVLNDQGAAPAGLLVENIGSPGIGEATIALKNIATVDSTWMIGLNETNHLSIAYGTQLVGGTTKMFLNANGNVGIGTVSPSQKLDVSGNIRTSGDVLRSQTGSANVVPICFGGVTSTGTIESGTGNFSVTHTNGTGIYTINITGESYSFITYNTIITPVGISPILASTFSSSGNLVIRLFNTSGTLVDQDFSFVVYRP